MKIAMLYGGGDLRLEEHDLDTTNLGPNEVWVKTEVTAFKSGTDSGNYGGGDPAPGSPPFPRGVGDSNYGTVQAVGSNVTCCQPGDHVVSAMYHQSEYVASDDMLIKVPEGVNPEDAVFANLYSLSAHCYHKTMFRPGENVAVVGLETLGLGAVALGPLFGARVVAIGNSDRHLEMAWKMGAHACFASGDVGLGDQLDVFTDGRGIDLVILAANTWPAYNTAVHIVRDNGRVAIASLLGRGEDPLDFNPLSMDRFYIKGISLHAISHHVDPTLFPRDSSPLVGYLRHRPHLLTLMAEGRLEPKQLITHRFHYTQIAQSHEMELQRDKTMVNAILDWQDA